MYLSLQTDRAALVNYGLESLQHLYHLSYGLPTYSAITCPQSISSISRSYSCLSLVSLICYMFFVFYPALPSGESTLIAHAPQRALCIPIVQKTLRNPPT